MSDPFRVGVSPYFKADPKLLEPILQETFGPWPHVTYEYLAREGELVTPAEIADLDAVIVLHSYFDAASLAGSPRLAVIARWGVGYDTIDVPACTEADVLLAITTAAVRTPVAEGIVTLLLALAKKLPAKERLVRTGRWDLKTETSGLGLRDKTLGSVGLGNIGGEMFRLLQPFGLGRRLAYDPYGSPETAAALGVEFVSLRAVFAESDFVTVNCPLTAETQGLINAELFALMKPTAYFINTARGPIVNQADLTAALQAGQLAGAGLDVFEDEPLPTDHPLTGMDNVILTPHAIAWTDDLYAANGVGACQNILTVFRGEIPAYTVNKAVAERPGFQSKLQALRRRWAAHHSRSSK